MVYETHLYQDYIRGFSGGDVLVQPNENIIPYGAGTPSGSALFNFTTPQYIYNSSS